MVMQQRECLLDNLDRGHVGEGEATAVNDEGVGFHPAFFTGEIEGTFERVDEVLDYFFRMFVGLGKEGGREGGKEE